MRKQARLSRHLLKGRDSIIVAIAALRIDSITGIANRAKIAPAANPVVPSMVYLYVFSWLVLPLAFENYPVLFVPMSPVLS